MHLYKRTILLDDILDRGNGYIVDSVDLSLDQGKCAPSTTIQIDSKYNPNLNYGNLKTDFINFVINLENTNLDIGVYNLLDYLEAPAVDEMPNMVTRISGVKLEKYLTTDYYLVSGQTESRLNEMDYYGALQINVNYSDEAGSFTAVLMQTPSKVVYVINAENNNGYVLNTGIKYTEYLIQKRIVYNPNTKSYEEINWVDFIFKGQGWTAENVELKELVKDDFLFGISSVLEIENDISINRGEHNVFENHFILGEVFSMQDLKNYRNNYFKL
jgi:hypothetical protein